MGHDKALIRTDGLSQVARLVALLARFVDPVHVSIGADQDIGRSVAGPAVIRDRLPDQGPLAGIVEMHRTHPSHAVLVVAVDMFGVAAPLVSALLERRRAVVSRHDSHTEYGDPPPPVTALAREDESRPEPLLAIWEPAALVRACEDFSRGERSPRRALRRAAVELIPRSTWTVHNINTRVDLARYRVGTERVPSPDRRTPEMGGVRQGESWSR